MDSNIIARPPEVWRESSAKTVTLVVTENCQLRCSYCYLVGKNSTTRMTFETATRAIDYIIGDREQFPEDAIVWDFIGGEPFLEIELIDRICDYIQESMKRAQHPWCDNHRFSFTTNGILYGRADVQRFIRKHEGKISIGLTIDGVPEKHDMHRVYATGKGSYADVVRNVPLWLDQFPRASTKVTVASADLPLIKSSVLHLFGIGIHHVSINVVFEDVWQEGDDVILEEQLIDLADCIIDQRLYTDHTCSFFSETIGYPRSDNNNWCGAGRMLAVDCMGNFYPCHRFTPFSMANRKPVTIGNCFDGIDNNKLRPFLSLDLSTQSSQECMDCDVATGCAWCQAANYDTATTNTIFQRATYLCKMHKARVRANNYYWHKLHRLLEAENPTLE